jgi:hypothetical protein
LHSPLPGLIFWNQSFNPLDRVKMELILRVTMNI